MTDDGWLSSARAAALCGVSSRTIQRWAKRDGLPAIRLGQSLYFTRSGLRWWVSRRRTHLLGGTCSTETRARVLALLGEFEHGAGI